MLRTASAYFSGGQSTKDWGLIVLRELNIRNFAIIDELHLTLEPGFNILTGETGAGKSILIDAVALLLGGRADTTAIRTGARRALIEGMFLLEPEQQAALAPILEEEGLDTEQPEILWLSRQLRSSGRSVARVNGTVVSVTLLREIAEGLVDIHGQSEHLSLLRVHEHLNLLDRFGGLMEARAEVREAVGRLQKVRRELRELHEGERDRMQRVDLLRFQVEEIEAAQLQPGELKELEAEQVRLAHAEQLTALASTLVELLEEGSEEAPSALDLLGRGQRAIDKLVSIDAALTSEMESLDGAVYQLEDVARRLRNYMVDVEFNPRRLAQVEERLVLLHHLQRKYGGDVAEVLEHARGAAEELERLEHSDERIAELATEEEKLLAEVYERAATLSEERRAVAAHLATGVEEELRDLRMQGASFGVAFKLRPGERGLTAPDARPAEVWVTSKGAAVHDETSVERIAFDPTGFDRVEFLIAPNVGEGLKPMARIASGGETARLMLALKTVLTRADATPTLIFDEIDQGIGGRVGTVVGSKLWHLTAHEEDHLQHQVLCITHLPQLAGFGDAHYRVQKAIIDGRTMTHVQRLDEATRRTELAQMLGTYGEAALQGAEELLAQAEKEKGRSISPGT
jgi:DNA repair protein RecN (Recombination protein N)